MATSVLNQSSCDDISVFHKMRPVVCIPSVGSGLHFRGSSEGVKRPLEEVVRWQLVSKEPKRRLQAGDKRQRWAVKSDHLTQLSLSRSCSTWVKTLSTKCCLTWVR